MKRAFPYVNHTEQASGDKMTGMRKIWVIILFLLCGTQARSQKSDEIFKRAYEFVREKELDSALFLYNKIVDKGKGDAVLIARAYFSIGLIYFDKKEYEKAKHIFLDILEKGGRSFEDDAADRGTEKNNYNEFTNQSCDVLAEIAIVQEDYPFALKYLTLAKDVYKYKHFCGNAHASNRVYLTHAFARCYAGMGDTLRAILTLLPEAFQNPLADNQALADYAAQLIKATYCQDEINAAFKKAIDNALYVNEKTGQQEYSFATITILGVIIKFDDWYTMAHTKMENESLKKMTKEEILRYFIKKDYFFLLLAKDQPGLLATSR